MSIERTIQMSKDFHNLAQQSIVDAFENAARAVHMHVVYHRPDSPSLVQEFSWGADDMLIPAMKFIEMAKDTRHAFDTAKGAFSIEQAVREMEDLISAVERDIQLSKALPPEFSISFRDHPHWEHAIMIEDIPFQRIQNVLRHWQQNLSSADSMAGALNHVTITHEPLNDKGDFRTQMPKSKSSNTKSAAFRIFH